MSTRKDRRAGDRRASPWNAADWLRVCHHNRAQVIEVLRQIRAGSVDETDLDRLQNFCQTSLALMRNTGAPAWQRARESAELAGLISDAVDAETLDFNVVMKTPTGEQDDTA